MVGQLCLAPGYGRASCACGCRSWCHRLQLESVRCPEALLLLAAPAVSHRCVDSCKTVAAPCLSGQGRSKATKKQGLKQSCCRSQRFDQTAEIELSSQACASSINASMSRMQKCFKAHAISQVAACRCTCVDE